MKKLLNTQVTRIKTYIANNKDQSISIAVAAGLLLVIVLMIVYTNIINSRMVYTPLNAAELLTAAEAQSLLGDDIIAMDAKKPEISEDVAISKISYTDTNPDSSKMIIAAVAVRTGINDAGVAKNEQDFALSESNNETDAITGVGDKAYFNRVSGQLHILKDQSWIILNIGIGTDPSSNSPEKAVELAKLVLN